MAKVFYRPIPLFFVVLLLWLVVFPVDVSHGVDQGVYRKKWVSSDSNWWIGSCSWVVGSRIFCDYSNYAEVGVPLSSVGGANYVEGRLRVFYPINSPSGTGYLYQSFIFMSDNSTSANYVMLLEWKIHYTGGIEDHDYITVVSYDVYGNRVESSSSGDVIAGAACVRDNSASEARYVAVEFDNANGVKADCQYDGVSQGATAWVKLPPNLFSVRTLRFLCGRDGTISGSGCNWSGDEWANLTYSLYVFTRPEGTSNGGLLGAIFGPIARFFGSIFGSFGSLFKIPDLTSLFRPWGTGGWLGSFVGTVTAAFSGLGNWLYSTVGTELGWLSQVADYIYQTITVNFFGFILSVATTLIKVIVFVGRFMLGISLMILYMFRWGTGVGFGYILLLLIMDVAWGVESSAEEGLAGMFEWVMWNWSLVSFPFRLLWYLTWQVLWLIRWAKQMIPLFG